MIIKLFSKMNCNVKCLLLLAIFAIQIFSAQTLPKISRFSQLNSAKGSMLKAVETTENHIYHVGSANSEVGFDGYNKEIQGTDEIFVSKSNVSDGSSIWLKTFNSAKNSFIDVKHTYIDGDDNIYVAGNFNGDITIGSQTISSSNFLSSGFILKIDANGNSKWINLLPQLGDISFNKFKMAADANDLFVVYSRNHLLRINNQGGEILYDQVIHDQIYFSSVIVKDDNLYVSGFCNAYDNAVIGTETIPYRSGFLLKGDKQGNFTASLQVVKPSSANGSGDVNDMAFGSDGKLIVAGFTLNSADLVSETSTYSYTFNPNTSFSGSKNYYYTAKVDANLEVVDYFRTSSSLVYSGNGFFTGNNPTIKVIPYGNVGNYRLIAKIGNLVDSFTNPNGSVTNTVLGDGTPYSFLVSCNNTGSFSGGITPMHPNRILNANSNSVLVSHLNYRLFSTFSMQIDNGSFKWTKEKTNSVGGILQHPYLENLKLDKSESFFSTIIEGNGDFFGKKVTNAQFVKSRYVARLGVDGLPKWTARFHVDSGQPELNSSNDFATVDKDDNFLFLANTVGNSSTFVDASNQAVDFQQANNLTSKVLIKIDKNGNLLWSKQLINAPQYKSSSASISTDSNGDVFLVGKAFSGTLTLDGYTLGSATSSSTFLVKLDGLTGNVVYAKTYTNLISDSIHPVFDADNNFYLFAKSNSSLENFNFDGVIIPWSYIGNNLMLKFNSSGNVIWGKNFYENSMNNYGNFASDVKFDGTDFIMKGAYERGLDANFIGLDLENIPIGYPSIMISPFIAKINTSGNVLWQKPIYTSSAQLDYSSIDIDEQKNIYLFKSVLGKIKFDDVEYNYDPTSGEKIIQKFDTNGNLKYNMVVDKEMHTVKQINVLKNDLFNVLGATSKRNIFNYPVNYNNSSNFFIATFGNLDERYLTPIKDYLILAEIQIPNNPDNANTFSFDLVTNTNWNAESDQSWLNLSFLSLVEKNNFKNSILGSGDAKIIISADTNNSGANRSGSILLNGTGVNSKTIIVTQTFVLSTGETKNIVTTLYPNPTSNILNIETKQKISKIEIFDLSGKLLKSENGKDKKVSVSNLTKGMYLIKLYTEIGVVNSKFIKK